MYIRLSAFLPVAALVAVAAATPTPGELTARAGGSSQCNTGPILCCNQTYQSTDTSVTTILGLLGVVLGDLTGLLGLGCSSIGGAGSSCSAQPVCCTGNTFNGLVNIGCNPIIINL